MAGKILLADDSNVALRMGTEILAAEGYEVLTVSNGQAAKKKLSDFQPDLILADIFMPGVSGYELCQYVKSETQFKNIPVVLLVGAMEPYDENEGRRVHADAVITKPLQSSNLLSVVKKLVKAKPAPPPPVPVAAPAPEAPPSPAATQHSSAIESNRAASAEMDSTAPESEGSAGMEAMADEPEVGQISERPAKSMEVLQEMEEQPLAAFGELLEPEGGPPQPEPESAAASPEATFPFRQEDFSEQIPEASASEPSATPFPLDFAFSDADSAEPSGHEGGMFVPFEAASAEAAESAQEDPPDALNFLSGSGEALEETAADSGLLSVLSESAVSVRDRKSTRLNSSHIQKSRMPSSA